MPLQMMRLENVTLFVTIDDEPKPKKNDEQKLAAPFECSHNPFV